MITIRYNTGNIIFQDKIKMKLHDENLGYKNPVGLRLPTELKEKIKNAAKQNKQSMNAEIVRRLERTFHQDEVEMQSDDAFISSAIHRIGFNKSQRVGQSVDDLINSELVVHQDEIKNLKQLGEKPEMLPLQEQIDYLSSRIDELDFQIRQLKGEY